MERLQYLKHHIERVEYWSEQGDTPEEVAEWYIWRFNHGWLKKPRDWNYPETPQFKNAIIRLVEAYRNGEEIEELDDWESDIFLDPMCNACRHCKNLVRELQIPLSGFEDILKFEIHPSQLGD